MSGKGATGKRSPAESARARAGIVLLTAAAAVSWFDASGVAAQRKGFILNLGIGPAVSSYQFSSGGFEGDRETKIAIGTDFKVGYAPTSQLLIYYSNDASFFSAASPNDALTASGLSGIGVTYFLAPGAPSFYVQGTIGISAWNDLSDEGVVDSMTGTGLNVGGGYEFAAHWNVDLDLIFGSADDDNFKVSVRTLRLAINWLLY